MNNIDDKISEIARRCAEKLGFRLVELTWQNMDGAKTLQVSVDKKGGITMDDISRFTDLFSPELDEVAELSFPYVLDCSSPGAERFVNGAEIFGYPDFYTGQYMEITDTTGQKYLGTVLKVDETDGLTIVYFIKGRQKTVTVKPEDVLKAQLRVKI